MAADMFLKIDGVKGESKDDKHKDEIELLSWGWGETQSGSSARGGGAGTGKVDMHDFNFSKHLDKASSNLLLFCAQGNHIPSVMMVARKAGGKQEEYLKIKFSDVMISSYQTSGSDGGGIPTESISLNYGKIEFEYFEQDAKGAVASAGKVYYDLKANKGGK